MPTRFEGRPCSFVLSVALATFFGCGEPSPRELRNRQEFEALLTAVSLRDKVELEKDAGRIEALRASGGLSESSFADLREIIAKARAGDWPGAEKQAYEFREKRPYFR